MTAVRIAVLPHNIMLYWEREVNHILCFLVYKASSMVQNIIKTGTIIWSIYTVHNGLASDKYMVTKNFHLKKAFLGQASRGIDF